MPAIARVNGTVVADTDAYEFVEGNVYFPTSSLQKPDEILTKTPLSTFCHWKGDASYYTLNVDGKAYENAVWYYADPYEKAKNIKDHVAFDKRYVQVEKS